jgi:hypothetical protein
VIFQDVRSPLRKVKHMPRNTIIITWNYLPRLAIMYKRLSKQWLLRYIEDRIRVELQFKKKQQQVRQPTVDLEDQGD